MTTPRWETPEQVDRARERIEASIEGWQRPAAFAVGLQIDGSAAETTTFPVYNKATSYLAASVLASVIGYASGTVTRVLTADDLARAVDALSPAEGCTAYKHPNLAAWRGVLAAARADEGATVVAVFVGDLTDPASSPVDAYLRTLL